MTRFRWKMLAAVMGGGCAVQAPAASLRFSPIGLDILSTARAASITIANTDAEPVALQLRIFKWSQIDNDEKLDPAADMLVSPPTVTIPANASYTIRIARSAATPVRTESSYRLIVDEIPKPADPRTAAPGIRLVLRTSIPVFVVDKDAIAILAWKVWQDADGLHASATNTGARHAKISGLTLQPATGPALSFGAGLNGYVLAGATKRFDLKPQSGAKPPVLNDGSQATLAASNDGLTIKATVRLGRN